MKNQDNFIESINTNFNYIKVYIEKLYRSTVDQILRQRRKILASYYEFVNLKKQPVEYGDSFYDLNLVKSEDNLVYDKDGYALKFKSKRVLFNPDYYKKSMYPMAMISGRPVPGTDFKKIFEDNDGFWAYQTDTETPFEFLLSFEKSELVNKIFIRTNNDIALTLGIKNASNNEFESLGDRTGQRHVWNFWPRKAVEIKITGVASLVSINYIDACLARYKTLGTFISKEFDIDNLYKLSLTRDICVPNGSKLNSYIRIVKDNVPGERISIGSANDLVVVKGGMSGIEWQEPVTESPYVPYTLDINYVPDSLLVRSGYQKFEHVAEDDWKYETKTLTIDGATGLVDFTSDPDIDIADYQIITNGVQSVYIDGMSGTFVKDVDYFVKYTKDPKKVQIIKIGDKIPLTVLSIVNDPGAIEYLEDNLKCDITLKKKIKVKQERIYIELQADRDITVVHNLQAGYKCTIRHLNLSGKINNEVLNVIANGDINYTFSGLEGSNLIEIEYFHYEGETWEPCEPPSEPEIIDVAHLIAFAYRYSLKRVVHSTELERGTYWIDNDRKIQTDDSDIFIKYAISSTADIKVIMEFDFVGNRGHITPTLRSYELKNSIVPGDLV